MNGRRAGTPGGDLATERIAAWLATAGLQPGGDNGTFLQSFTLERGRRVGPGAILELDGRALRAGREWAPHGGSRAGEVTGPIVFAGDDLSGELRDKIVIAPAKAGARLEQLITARQRGATAVLLSADALPTIEETTSPVDIVSGAITRAAADALQASNGPRMARLVADLTSADVSAANVIGVLPGTDPALTHEAIVLGAHWDHLGGSGGAVYHGADDNASGTAVVVGLARAFAASGGVSRTLVFALFGAEESGLIGSRYYVRQPAVPLSQTLAMVNFDMVGRLRDGKLIIGGVDSGDRLRAAAAEATRGANVVADLRGNPYSPSDHSPFYTAGTPVLFLHTGTHDDYHRPSDTLDRLNVDGLARVADVGARIVAALDAGGRPVYARVPDAERRRGRQAPAGVTFLGVGSDGRAGDGVRLARIVPGSAAERAGLRDGDVLVRIDDVSLNDFEALRKAILARNPGDTVRLMYLRDGRDHVTSATLERSQP